MGILAGHHRPDQFTSVTTKMFKLLSKTWILLLTLALISTLAPIGKQNFVNAEDPLEDEIDNNEADEEVAAEDINVADEDVKTDEYDDFKLGSSPDAETTILFTKPAGSASDLPAGKVAEFLIGFSNKGNQEMLIESVEAAFHYPMDHTFVIQNFSAIHYNKVVKPLQQATVGYSFLPADPFAGQLMWLTARRAVFTANLSSMKPSTLLKWMKVWMEKHSSSMSFSQLVLFCFWFWASRL